MFNSLKIECDDNVEEIFDINEINKLTENKVKIFDKDNSFIKKEFNFEISECQHKYPSRFNLNKNNFKNINIINTNENINNNINREEENIEIEKIDQEIKEMDIKEENNINNESNNKIKEKILKKKRIIKMRKL